MKEGETSGGVQRVSADFYDCASNADLALRLPSFLSIRIYISHALPQVSFVSNIVESAGSGIHEAPQVRVASNFKLDGMGKLRMNRCTYLYDNVEANLNGQAHFRETRMSRSGTHSSNGQCAGPRQDEVLELQVVQDVRALYCVFYTAEYQSIGS